MKTELQFTFEDEGVTTNKESEQALYIDQVKLEFRSGNQANNI